MTSPASTTDGFVWIESRVSDVINRGGNKVLPAQVEDVLRSTSGVRDAAVVGASDARLGEVPVAFFVGDADPADLEARCRDQLVAYKVPVAFHRVDALPRNEVGKVLRRELLATLETDGRLAVGPETPAAEVLAAVRAWVDDNVPRHGAKRRSVEEQPPSARSGREPSTRPGTRCSRVPVSSCRRGRSRTAASI